MTEIEVKRVAEKTFAYTTLALWGIQDVRETEHPQYAWKGWVTHWDIAVMVPNENALRTIRVPDRSHDFLFEQALKKAIVCLADQLKAERGE